MAKAIIQGFSKLTQDEKINAIALQLALPELSVSLKRYWHPAEQALFDKFSENTLTNYYLPLGIAPNFIINNQVYHVPMVTEESSVVAAASAAAKFWMGHGGFHATVLDVQKTGHVYFRWSGSRNSLLERWPALCEYLLSGIKPLLLSMENRGGGLRHLQLTENVQLPEIFMVELAVDTVDAMGANYINTLLEHLAEQLSTFYALNLSQDGELEIIMAILSNYTPECIVRCSVEAPFRAFDHLQPGITGKSIARKIHTAVTIAHSDINRAVTHNKGIMNGVDAVVIATGNDFRAVEAGAHAYAARRGSYASLSSSTIDNDIFRLNLEIPLAIGTVGGLTDLHPIARCSLNILENPRVKQLMIIVASAGLACHFAALRALVTKGIQHGHMKMHLSNILAQLGASEDQKQKAQIWFSENSVSYPAVREFLRVN